MDREFILNEIRRTAAENGGRPLGARRFGVETGIRESDWLGKLWARWGDALREAGLEPNSLQGAFDDQFILKRYAELVRELGHVPVKAELQMKAHRDQSFPNVVTFLRRLGARERAVPRLIDYSERAGGYQDVVEICRAWKPTKTPEAQSVVPEKPVVLGYVYLLRSGRHYKVGRSNAVGRRERELAIQLPQKGEVIHKIATDDPAGIEAYWQHRFEGKRGNGEWFNLSADDVAAFRRRRSM